MTRANANHQIPAALTHEFDTARSELRQGRFAAARPRFESILKRAPNLVPALHFLGVLEHMDGDSAKGLALLQRAHAQAPEDFDIRKNLGNMLNDMNRCDEAQALYRAILAERPTDASNHLNLCVALRKLGRSDEAVASGRRAVELDPDNAAAWLALANALACTRELEQAVQAFERVLAIKPDFSPAHDSLCRVLLRIEQSGLISRFRRVRTRQAYRRWLEAVPGNPTAAFLLDALDKGTPPARVPDAMVKANFDAYAQDFDKHIRLLGYRGPELIADALARRLPTAQADLEILDGGCGTGLGAPLLRPYARKLVGVDLSPAMLARARASGHYDELCASELGEFLAQQPQQFDVCVFADVFIYFGDLHAILAAAARALRPGGLIAFTVEKSSRRGSQLNPTGRYSHHPAHTQDALAAAGFSAIEHRQANLRNEGNVPVAGLVVSGRRRQG